jgi:hypothetical protein
MDGLPEIRTPEQVEQRMRDTDPMVKAEPHRDALDGARELLRAYGTKDGLGFAQTYSAVQTAVLEYRDSGVTDPVCEEHRNWMTARVSEITAAALYAAGVLK